jgi:hypothetical protein
VGNPNGASDLDGRGATLTPSGRALLAGLAHGASVGDTAAPLRWTERAVYVRLASAGRKPGAHSGLEALMLAVRRGDISRPVVGRHMVFHVQCVEWAMAPDIPRAPAIEARRPASPRSPLAWCSGPGGGADASTGRRR